MIEFLYRTDFELTDKTRFVSWIKEIIKSEQKKCGDITYTFCDDQALDEINQKFLNHKDLTDIISFDDSIADIISGEIFISIDRIKENANIFGVSFEEELLRVMSHGILHFCGYTDGDEEEKVIMRRKEDEKIKMFHVEHSFKNKKK
ncbi:MAG TPA: rRNA maturation RNase YbeY [Flavobacteriaceae bacterium]|nr:rRNA maturation RNase YbeY [Flavobacteriaceae bacterium]